MERRLGANRDTRSRGFVTAVLAALCIALTSGCATTSYIQKRNLRENPLAASLALFSDRGPHESPRTHRLLQRFDLAETYKENPTDALIKLQSESEPWQKGERIYAVAELAYIQGQEAKRRGEPVEALKHFSRALSSSYAYLFSEGLEEARNPYDPQYRGACDLYNEALEDMLRLLRADGRLQPNKTYQLTSGNKTFTIKTKLDEQWDPRDFKDFDHFAFASEYEIKTLNNRHTTYGLGVPLIAVRKMSDQGSPMENYYPGMLSFACTALLRCDWTGPLDANDQPEPQCELVFYNPMRRTRAEIAGRTVPLETDITTPLAFFLDNEQFHDKNIATLGLFKPNKLRSRQGLYMLEAYDPQRIPVVMVHGLWSSPMTWMDMFNDLRSFPEIRERYQVWFYLYPTGQPFWISAVQMRKDLKDLRETIDRNYPRRDLNTMDQMVLVGHSMGGLVSRLQTMESGNDFWDVVSNKSIDELEADDDDRAKLASTLFFHPNESVRRVITIGTPHKGSHFSNPATQWLGRRLIRLPSFLTNITSRLIRNNPDYFRNTDLLTTTTSIDSLSPDSPIFPAMARAKRNPNVKYHNIFGKAIHQTPFGEIEDNGDGIVSIKSAKLKEAVSEIDVEATHTDIHTKPKTILEVRRVLLEHAAEIDARDRVANLPVPNHAIEPVSLFFSDDEMDEVSKPNIGLLFEELPAGGMLDSASVPK
ncbi:MAG: hypothetical protein R3C05_07855 [Pirellulaceae bacterium]